MNEPSRIWMVLPWGNSWPSLFLPLHWVCNEELCIKRGAVKGCAAALVGRATDAEVHKGPFGLDERSNPPVPLSRCCELDVIEKYSEPISSRRVSQKFVDEKAAAKRRETHACRFRWLFLLDLHLRNSRVSVQIVRFKLHPIIQSISCSRDYWPCACALVLASKSIQ